MSMRATGVLGDLWRELRGQRTRAVLSLLSVAWGTLAILCLLAFSFGFESLFHKRQRGIGEGVAIAWPQRTTIAWRGFPPGRPVRLFREDALALAANVPGLRGLSGETIVNIALRTRERVLRVSLAGVEVAYGELRALTPAPGGRWLNEPDIAGRRRVIFLGDGFAAQLFGTRDAVGRSVIIRGQPFLVVGVLQPKQQDSDYSGRDANRAFVPAPALDDLLGRRPLDDLVYRAADARQHETVTAALVRACAARHGFDPDDTRALGVWNTAEEQRMLGFIFLGFHVVLGIAGLVTVTLGGVAVAHLMAFLVRRRRAEIGLKLAVGATPTTVRREVLGQALVLAGGGALLGLGAAGLVVTAVAASPLAAQVGVPHLPPLVTAAGTLVLVAVGFLAGWYPARAAARLDPVEALRGGGR